MIKKVWEKWLWLAGKIGNFNSQVIMTVFYLLILLPVGIIYALFGDTLKLKPSARKSNFNTWAYKTEDIEKAKHQY